MTLTVSSSSSTFACKSPSISHPWLPFAHLFIEKNSPTLPKTTRLPRRLFWPCPPKVIKNTNHGKPVDILSTGMIASTRIHKLIALSVRRPPFQSRAWESVLESLFWSCQVLYWSLATLSIVPPPRRLSATICLQLPSRRHSQSLTSSPPSDKTGAKSLTSPRNVNMFFYFATASLSSMQSSGDGTIEIRIHALSLKCYQGRRRGGEVWPWSRRHYAWSFWKRDLLIDNRLFLGPR